MFKRLLSRPFPHVLPYIEFSFSKFWTLRCFFLGTFLLHGFLAKHLSTSALAFLFVWVHVFHILITTSPSISFSPHLFSDLLTCVCHTCSCCQLFDLVFSIPFIPIIHLIVLASVLFSTSYSAFLNAQDSFLYSTTRLMSLF